MTRAGLNATSRSFLQFCSHPRMVSTSRSVMLKLSQLRTAISSKMRTEYGSEDTRGSPNACSA